MPVNSELRAARTHSRISRNGEAPAMNMRGICADIKRLRGKFVNPLSPWGKRKLVIKNEG